MGRGRGWRVRLVRVRVEVEVRVRSRRVCLGVLESEGALVGRVATG